MTQHWNKLKLNKYKWLTFRTFVTCASSAPWRSAGELWFTMEESLPYTQRIKLISIESSFGVINYYDWVLSGMVWIKVSLLRRTFPDFRWESPYSREWHIRVLSITCLCDTEGKCPLAPHHSQVIRLLTKPARRDQCRCSSALMILSDGVGKALVP